MKFKSMIFIICTFIALGIFVFGASVNIFKGTIFSTVSGAFASDRYGGNKESVSELNTEKPLPDAKTGTPLPAGGGEPGKVYMIYLKAVQTKDLKTLKKVSSLEDDDVSGDEMGYALELLAEMAPKNVKIVKGYVSGNRAALYAEGTYENEKQYGTVEMLKEKNGQWRLAKENWSNVPPKK